MRTVDSYEIKLKRLDYLFDNLTSGIIAKLTLSTIILVTFYSHVQTNNLLIWFTLNIVLLVARGVLLLSYNKNSITEENFSMYYKQFYVLAVLSAFLWGSGAFIILPESIELQVVMILIVAGLVSGAFVSFSSQVEIFYVYATLSLLPYSYVFIFGDAGTSHVFSISIVLYTIVLLLMAKKVSTSVNNNIIFHEENKNLILLLQEKVKEADAANRSKSEFLSIMSHEIRTPLNSIIGFVGILRDGEKDRERRKYLDTIDKSSKVLKNIINDILDITKIESGKFTLEAIEFNPKEEFESLYVLFEQAALEKGINLIDSTSENLPKLLKGDILRVKQIISNLLSNAIKFTPIGKNIEFIVNFDVKSSTVYIEVRDEGIGISKENIESVTDAFMQADSSTAREYGGTGLGLSIVNNLLNLFNSKLEIRSELGVGSRFFFSIEVEVIEHCFISIEEIDERHFKNKKILVAEDNRMNQMLIRIILKGMNIDITMANDGLEAQEIFKKDKFDLVLMDINMPNRNGIEAMLDIKEFEKTACSTPTPVVAFTANSIRGDKEKYLRDGFDEYLAKPIDIKELQRVFKKYFNR